MSQSKRLKLELEEVRAMLNNFRQFRDLEVNEKNILNWTALIVPDNKPYNNGAWKVELNFPSKNEFNFNEK